MGVILETDLPLKPFSKGKVREMYDLDDKILMIATDRISAFDSILPDGIPLKGKILNKLSSFWFKKTKDVIDNHMISDDFDDFPEEVSGYRDMLDGRSMIVKKTGVVPIECVARGYLSGSAWKEYKEKGSVCGMELPKGLVESDKLPEPVFTPATKAESGHDINISFAEACNLVGDDVMETLRKSTIGIYKKASEYALSKGIIIADTKFEFGSIDNGIILIDEALTPDSSRFWPLNEYKPGGPQPSFDKQYVRDYLIEIGWDKEPPAPRLTKEVIEGTTRKYVEAYERLTGEKLI